MTWSEPLQIGRRLAECWGAPLYASPSIALGSDAGDDVLTLGVQTDGADEAILVVDEETFQGLSTRQVRGAAAVVIVGGVDRASSAGLRALEHSAVDAGASVATRIFAKLARGSEGLVEVPLVVATWRDPGRLQDLLAAGPHSLLLDPSVDAQTPATLPAPARVCVVTFEVSGLTGGGIGTASTSLAQTLARVGHEVVLLFTGWQEADAVKRNEHWRAHYAESGVRLEIIRAPGTHSVKNPHFPVRSAYEVYCWLRREQPFDVVHVPENMGHGYFAQLAKLQGSHFTGTTFVVGTHGPTRWAAEANRTALTLEEFLVNDFLERFSVANADLLLGPSTYLHDYLRSRGWEMPARVHVQPYALPAAVRSVDEPEPNDDEAPAPLPRELVFFGRLETRKGVATFCDALDLLAGMADCPPFEVTFLGPVAEVLGESADDYIARRALDWPWQWRLLADRDQRQAADYLRRPGVMAVMPGHVDNAPNTVSEAVALGVPLVAGRGGGTGELIRADQRDDHTFMGLPPAVMFPLPLGDGPVEVDARPLAELLLRRLTTPTGTAQAPSSSASVDAAYDRWHRAVHAARDGQRPSPQVGSRPSLSICVLYAGNADLLGAQLDALDAATAESGVEVVVVDARARAEGQVPHVSDRGVVVVSPAKPGHAAAARAAAVAASSGDLLAVLPSTDVPLIGFADALRSAAAATDAHVYSCVVLDERDPDVGEKDAMVGAFVPVDGPSYAGLTHPAFIVGPYAIRRAALDRLGGFDPSAHGDEVDHELLNRAAVAGLRLETVPEPLAAKRARDRWTTMRAVWPHVAAEPPYDAEQWLCVERPFTQLSQRNPDLLGLMRGARTESVGLRRDLRETLTVVADQRSWVESLEAAAAEQRTWIENLEATAADLREEREDLRERLRQLRQQFERTADRRIKRALRRLAQRLGRDSRPEA
ncbi:MAG TPA: glycosyltransferase [Solirubrobacteraceae bacterium]|jgi:glycosyltransferase involved in cell wall biosynthesis/uncharacterized coiled-coil protein SlyX|nr:glycosyltransferase [Solirubrobacteraceae bacterium]